MAKTEGKHRIAEVLPVGSDVSPELTRQYLADAVSTKHFSRLTDKILGRPPVKFVFSIVCDILKTTKYVLGTSSIMMLPRVCCHLAPMSASVALSVETFPHCSGKTYPPLLRRYNKDLLENLEARGIGSKQDRLACVKLISDTIGPAAGYKSPLIIPSKVCAGKQVDRTRLMLSACAHVALDNEVGSITLYPSRTVPFRS